MVCGAALEPSFHFSPPPIVIVISSSAPSLLSFRTGHARRRLLCNNQPVPFEELFPELPLLGFNHVRPVITAYNPVLREAGDNRDLPTGRFLHAHILLMGFLPDLFLSNLLVQMYGKCGSLDDVLAVFGSMRHTNVFSWTLLMGALIQYGMLDSARTVFDSMPERDVISWNSMIAAYSQNTRDRDALELFELMQLEGCIPDSLTFVSVLTACTHLKDLAKCMEMHASILSLGLEKDRDLVNPLINMYNKCGSLKDTWSLFHKLEDHPNFAWNALIATHVREGYTAEAFHFYKLMSMSGISPDDVTFITLLGSLDSQDHLADGRHLHACIIEAALEPDVMIGNALLSMYGRCEAIDDAHTMFNRMVNRNVISWNALITVHTQLGHANESLVIFSRMELSNVEPDKVTFVTILDACAAKAALAEGRKVHDCLKGSAHLSDFVVMTALLNMYGRCGSLEDAQEIFDSIIETDIISWNALIAAYVQNNCFDKASQLFQKMQAASMQPNEVTYANILVAYASEFALKDGQDLHAQIVSDGVILDTLVSNSLINFYGKCGRVEDAWITFQCLPKGDTVSWNAMITAHSQHGLCKEALDLLQHMQLHGKFPNGVTFLSILTAFSRNGLVSEGCMCFHSMIKVYSVTPSAEHYNIMVDLFGRAGRLDDAEAIVEKMPMEPNTTTWMGVLGACRTQVDLARGIHSASHVLYLDPYYNPAYVVLSDLSTFKDV